MRRKVNNKGDSTRQLQALSLLIEQGKNGEAWQKIRARLMVAPNDIHFLHAAARLARRGGQPDEARRYYQRALRLMPDDAGMLNGMALTFYDSGNYQEAEKSYRAALKAHSAYPACHNNYAIVLHKMRRYHEAIVQYRHALSVDPRYSQALYGLSTVLAHTGELDAAEEAMRQYVYVKPSDGRCANALGMVLMQKGEYREGWPLYQARYAEHNPDRFYSLPALNAPYWRGQNLAGKTILVRTEQGMGDEIQFCRFLPHLKTEKGAARVIMSGRAPLQRLIETDAFACRH